MSGSAEALVRDFVSNRDSIMIYASFVYSDKFVSLLIFKWICLQLYIITRLSHKAKRHGHWL